jgi:hypothetical protein
MEPRSDRADGHAQDLSDLLQGQAAVVVKDHHSSLIGAQPLERSVELVAIGHDEIRSWLNRRWRIEVEGRRPSPRRAELIVAGAHQDPVRP